MSGRDKHDGISPRVWASSFVIGLSSLLFGYCLASLNTVITDGSVGSILKDINLSTEDQQVATAMTILGAMIGGLFASYPNDMIGRKKSLLLNNAFFIGGGVLCGISDKSALLAGRFLVGLGTGVESMIAPVLLGEIASASTRGAVTSLHQLMITIGILLAGLIGYGYVQNVNHGWRYVQLFIVLPAALQLVLFWLVPESPRWLLRNDRRDEAKKVLVALRRGDEDHVASELAQIEQDLGDSMNQPQATWTETFSYTVAMRIGMLLMFFSAMTGINTVIFYSTTIFKLAGVSNAFLGTVLVGVLNVIMTIVSGYLVDRAGRKVLLTGGTWTMFVSLLLLGIMLLVGNTTGVVISAISVGSVLLYVLGFAIGLGAVQWVVVGEVVPTQIRSKAYSLFVTSNWTANLVVSLTTLSLIKYLGKRFAPDGSTEDFSQQVGVAILYLIFAVMCLLCLLFLYVDVPETKGRNADGAASASNAALSPRSLQRRKSSAAQNLLDPSADADKAENGTSI